MVSDDLSRYFATLEEAETAYVGKRISSGKPLYSDGKRQWFSRALQIFS
jgi:hypothetical protein